MLTRPGWVTPFLALMVLVGAVLVLRPVGWEATATLTVRPPADAPSVAGSAGSAQRLDEALADMHVAPDLAAGLSTTAEVGGVAAPDGGRTVRVSVSHADPRLAAGVADAVAATTSAETAGVEVGELSRVPTRPAGPHPSLLLGAGLLGSWVVAVGGAALARRLPW